MSRTTDTVKNESVRPAPPKGRAAPTDIRAAPAVSRGARDADATKTLVPGIPARVHALGAGGAGVSGAMLLLRERGHHVSGHDRADSRFVRALSAIGVACDVGASVASGLPADAELVLRSAAVGDDDPQIALARARGIPVLKYSEALGRVAPPRRTLAVAGTHGKTTSSWMLYYALRGLSETVGRSTPLPGALVGGVCRTLGVNAVSPASGGWFVAEACEYDRSFLALEPEGAIVTNVEPDHLDYYGTFDAVREAFARFVDRIHPDGLLVVGRDVPDSVIQASPCTVWRLGREVHVELCGESHGFFKFRLRAPGWATPEVMLSVPGAFNVENAAATLALAVGLAARGSDVDLDLAAESAARSLHRFRGAERRFEPWGTAGGVEVIHDYAHHPTEVRATIEAARRTLPGKPLHVLFQPHQHSRTARFMDEFVESLRGAERVVVADVYGARTHIDTRGAGAEELAMRLKRAGLDAVHGGDANASVKKLCERLCGGSAALILGAGDIDLVKHDLLEELALRSPGARGSIR